MEILSVDIHNILSIGDISQEFGSDGLILYEGWNLDDNRANGAGKSAIFNAISFAIYEKIPRKITKSEILRKGAKEGYCKVNIRANNHIYSVKRCRPTSVEYYIDGNIVSITQEEFEEKIGFSYEQFLITMYTAQNTQQKFIFLNDSGKKDFILALMKLTTFNDFYKQTKNIISELEKDILVKENELKNLQSKVDIYKESLVDENNISSIIVEHQKEINNYKEAIIQLQAIPKPDLSKYHDLEVKISDANNHFSVTEINRNNAMNNYSRDKKIIETPFIFNKPKADTNCPDCNTPLVVRGKQLFHLEDTSAQELQAKEEYDKLIEEAEIRMSESLKLINKYDQELTKRQQVKNLEIKLIEQKKKDFKDYDDAQVKINDYNRCLITRNINMQNLQTQLVNNSHVQLKIKDVLKDAVKIKTEKTCLEDELNTVKLCSTIFAPTGAPAYIMDSIVTSFNDAVSEYVQLIWPSATYSLQTHKMNSDKTVVAKFSEELVINGKSRSIGSLSGGELRSLSLALDFAILDVLAAQYGIALNPVILDEPFDGLDSIGREIVIDLLQVIAKKRQIIVVDHTSEAKTLFTDIVRVEKKSGISSIVEIEV